MRRPIPISRLRGLADPDGGLTAAEVAERLSDYGPNEILETVSSGWRDILQDTLRDPMVWFLVGTAVLFVWLGELAEAAVLAVALVPIAGMDAWLHRRTQATTEGLRGRLAARATVLRNGERAEIPADGLVPGDLVLLASGDSFPADGLLVGGEGLQADESALTGEAMPVRKRPFNGAFPEVPTGAAAAGPDEIGVDGSHWGMAGTRLLTGVARLRVVHTGGETLYGEIARSARAGSHERTPLQLAISNLVSVLVAVAAILCLVLAGVRYHQGYGLLDAVLSAVTLAIAALPEEFPVVFAFFLGVGVYRLGQRQALVRRAVVVENIGRITCICTDKTGTLTEGELRLAHMLAADGVEDASLVAVAAMASRGDSGDPLDLLLCAASVPPAGERVATFPFTEDRRREVAVLRDAEGAFYAAVKGAPETVLAMSALDDSARADWLQRTAEFAASGHKVIACASRRLDSWAGAEPDRAYRFAGLLAFEDPLRDGVQEAVAQARDAGIRVIMVTGDHPLTAAAIAREVGLGAGIGSDAPRVIEGDALAGHLARSDGDGVGGFDVIARAIPAQKLDLVRALQAAGEIVAVTGDGVNDVPALQGADIGIAMGERGTRTAREVASIVLLDDNFRTIVRAIGEGRQLFRNLRLSFAYLLMVHAPLVATAALVPLFGYPLLYLPAHVVWLELIIHPTALLVFQQLPASDALSPVDRAARGGFFGAREWASIALVGGLVTLLVLLCYRYSLGPARDVAHARAMAMVALIVAGATVTAVLSGLRGRAAVLSVTATVGSALLLVQVPVLARLLHMSPLHAVDWAIATAGGIGAGAAAALVPWLERRRRAA